MKLIISLFAVISFSLSSAQNVYKTPSGSKYHLASCRMVKNVSASLSLVSARNQGLDACKISKPPLSVAKLGVKRKTAGVSNLSQCRGITKAKARCKRKTRIGNNYCFQHQP